MGLKIAIILQVVLVTTFIAFVNSTAIRHKYKFLADDSCEGRCNQTGTVPGACQCNSACVRYNDCCSDYYSLCQGQTGTCAGRCDQVGTIPGTCQCNKPCVDHNDCCPDYADLCLPGDAISNQEIEDLAEELLNLDTENNATTYISINLQGKTSSGSSSDEAPLPLLTVAASAFSRSTIQKLTALQDNYEPDTSKREEYTPEEEAEIDSFIESIFNTRIMQTAQQFLALKNLPNGREKFREMWFEFYNRETTNSSCGFEHVFVGELKSNEVSGFHNWEQFAVEEGKTEVDYKGYMDFVDFGDSKGSIIEHRFSWQNKPKPISSMFIGTSPELELALYTVCFHARPDSKCTVSLNGRKIKIQTWTSGSRKQYVGTSYPDLSD